jgi:hypothetical protein
VRLHIGREHFPLPWGEQQIFRSDLAQIAFHGVRLFGEVDHERRQETKRKAHELFGRPGGRNIGEIFRMRPHAVRGHDPIGVLQQETMREHRSFRPAGSAGRIADGRDIILTAGLDGQADRTRAYRFSCALQVAKAAEQWLAIVPQSTRIDVDDARDAPQVAFDREKFVDLLLIFGEQHFGFAVIEDV